MSAAPTLLGAVPQLHVVQLYSYTKNATTARRQEKGGIQIAVLIRTVSIVGAPSMKATDDREL
jgi:hypothetical protein